eukprot:6520830-Prymnesium_polylepis.1
MGTARALEVEARRVEFDAVQRDAEIDQPRQAQLGLRAGNRPRQACTAVLAPGADVARFLGEPLELADGRLSRCEPEHAQQQR